MEASNVEFKELLARSGWNQAKAARELDLTTASISRYMNDIDTPSKQTIRLFRMLLNLTEEPAPVVLKDERPAGSGVVNPAVKELIDEIEKLKDQVASVERVAERLKPVSSPHRGRKGSIYDPAKVPVPPAQAEFDKPDDKNGSPATGRTGTTKGSHSPK